MSDRQLQLLEQRRQRLDQRIEKPSKYVLPTKPSKPPLVVPNTKLDSVKPEKASLWGLEQTNTAPTRSWGSSASDASSATNRSSFSNPQKSFYGQAIPKKERKKMYDDTGASYYESMSEASASVAPSTSSHKKLESASTALTEALTKSSSHDSSNMTDMPEVASEAPSFNSKTSSIKESTHVCQTSRNDMDMKSHLKKRLLASMAEKRKDQGKPVAPLPNEDARDRRQSFGLNRPKVKGAPDDQQRAFLRNLIQSAYRPKEQQQQRQESNMQKPCTESQSEDKASMVSRQSSANPATRSATSCSSTSEDKAIMRKVLERSRKKRLSNDKRQNFVKKSSTKMKKLLAPHCSPRSHTSDESANDERSFGKQPRRSVTPRVNHRTPTSGKRTPRREKTNKSPRFLSVVSRWSGGSQADDEAENQERATIRDPTDSSTDSVKHREPLQEMNNAPNSIDVKEEITEVSALTRKSTNTPGYSSIKEGLEFDEDCASHRYSIMSRPSILYDDEIEVEVETQRHARAVTESLMEPVDLDSPKLQINHQSRSPKVLSAKTHTAFPELGTLDEEEPEGYAEFVATLKAEVAASHSLLWQSFHGLFDDSHSTRPLSDLGACHFDETTKDMVTEMSSYLKKNPHVICMTGTQLANDKVVRENRIPIPNFSHQFLEETHSSYTDYNSDKENDRHLVRFSSTDRINEAPNSNEIEVTLGQFVQKGMGGVSDKKVTAQVRTANSTLKPKTTKHVADASRKANTQPTPHSTMDGSVPWSDIKLRSVADANKSEAASSSIPASWTKVKLRPVSAKNDKNNDNGGFESETPTNVPDDSSDFRRILVSKKKTVEKSPGENDVQKKKHGHGPEVIEIIDLADIPSTESNPIDLTSKSNEDKPIDLTSAETPRTTAGLSHADTRANATAVTADGTVLVSLAPEPNSEPVKVLIGRNSLVKIQTRSGETKARVIWRLDLDDVQSAMLDLASFKVKLLLNSRDDHKDLAFATSDQCMRFANALHEMTNASSPEDHIESDSVEESVFVEQLNEEEQRVLEEFRQNKKQAETRCPYPIDTDHEKPMSVIDANASAPFSPLSEISGPGSALSSADIRVAQSYQNMLKLQVPKEAVRHKMEQDDVNPKIIDFVLGVEAGLEELSSQAKPLATSNLTVDEEKIAAGYRRMLKMRIPPDAVRHKMEKEGVNKKIIRDVLGTDTVNEKEPEEASSSELTSQEEVVATPYRKMLKMMIPKEAVEHKMKKDQIDEKIIVAVVGISTQSSRSATSNPSIPKLTDEEESVASSYRKMIGLRIPREAVKQKMESEGISRKIIASVLGEKLSSDDNKKGQTKRSKQGFHWNPLNSSENLKNSVWSKSSFDSGFLDDDDDISTQVEQFAKKPESDEASRATTVKSSADSKDKAKLIDLSRANNIAITLKAFNEFSSTELAQIIEFVDPFEKIKGDRALFMKDLLPNSAEIKVIKTYQGDYERLVPAEKWFRQIVDIQRIEEKIHVLRTMESFRNEAIALGDSFQQLTKVCNQVMNSEKLPDLLEMVRQIGNRMNDSRSQEAAGFKLDFLPRLAQTKGSDKKTTALDLVVMIFNTRGRRQALMLGDDFPNCFEASRIQVSELLADVKMLSGAMRKCQKELETLQREIGRPPRSRATLAMDCHSDSGVNRSKKSSRAQDEDEVRTEISSMHEQMFAKRSQLINTVLNKSSSRQPLGAETNDDTSISLHEKSYSQQGAINRIRKFVEEANIIFPELEAKRDRALAACKELADFFCESGGEKAAPTLLGILSEFASNLDKALAKYDQQQKTDARKKANEDKASKRSKLTQDSEKKKNDTSASFHLEKKSLVLMVNEMLKIAGDKEKADFIKGVTYDNPDSRLKKIYEAEQALGKPIGSPATTRKNIMRTIEERRQLDGSHDSRVALSELALAMQSRTASTDSTSPTARTSTTLFSESLASPEPSMTHETVTHSRKSHRMSIAERWTRKESKEEDDCADEIFTLGVSQIERTDSQILTSESQDSEDKKFEEKKRKEYMSRWARQNTLLKSESTDFENESDVGALLEYHSKTRQRYISRWASKPGEGKEDNSISSP